MKTILGKVPFSSLNLYAFSFQLLAFSFLPLPATIEQDVEPAATNILYQSTDGGQTWQDISDGLPVNEVPEDFFAGESELYLRLSDGLYRSKSNLSIPVWEKVNADPGNASIAINRSGRVRNLVEAEGVHVATCQKGIMRSTDNGDHWQAVINEGGVGIAIERIEGGFAAIAYNTSTKTRRIHVSLDRGQTWKVISDGLPKSMLITSIKQVGKYLLCGHPDGIFRSSDMGKTWNIVHPGVEFQLRATSSSVPVNNSGKVFELHVSGNIVYAVAKNAGC